MNFNKLAKRDRIKEGLRSTVLKYTSPLHSEILLEVWWLHPQTCTYYIYLGFCSVFVQPFGAIYSIYRAIWSRLNHFITVCAVIHSLFMSPGCLSTCPGLKELGCGIEDYNPWYGELLSFNNTYYTLYLYSVHRDNYYLAPWHRSC